MRHKPGTRVLITQDCREGRTATGKEGTYEGDFPYSVMFGNQITPDGEPIWFGEWMYEPYKSGALKANDGRPANEVFPEWERGKPKPLPNFAMTFENPRIRLDDGSVIWGAECWWGEVIPGETLEQAQTELKEFKGFIAGMVEELAKREKGETK